LVRPFLLFLPVSLQIAATEILSWIYQFYVTTDWMHANGHYSVQFYCFYPCVIIKVVWPTRSLLPQKWSLNYTSLPITATWACEVCLTTEITQSVRSALLVLHKSSLMVERSRGFLSVTLRKEFPPITPCARESIARSLSVLMMC
jgi:hypothetical protein